MKNFETGKNLFETLLQKNINHKFKRRYTHNFKGRYFALLTSLQQVYFLKIQKKKNNNNIKNTQNTKPTHPHTQKNCKKFPPQLKNPPKNQNSSIPKYCTWKL